MIVCPEIKQKQPRDPKTSFETLSVPDAKILSPVARQAPTKCLVRRLATNTLSTIRDFRALERDNHCDT